MISLKKFLYPQGVSAIYFIIIFVVSVVLFCIYFLFYFKSTCLVLVLI